VSAAGVETPAGDVTWVLTDLETLAGDVVGVATLDDSVSTPDDSVSTPDDNSTDERVDVDDARPAHADPEDAGPASGSGADLDDAGVADRRDRPHAELAAVGATDTASRPVRSAPRVPARTGRPARLTPPVRGGQQTRPRVPARTMAPVGGGGAAVGEVASTGAASTGAAPSGGGPSGGGPSGGVPGGGGPGDGTPGGSRSTGAGSTDLPGADGTPHESEVMVEWGGPAEPTPSSDNLKEIVGIGPVVEARLRTLGITTFRQLAVMGDADVDRLRRGLDGFGERIIDDDWAGQARDLQALRHGGLA
jgi:hypothetical protein